MTIQKTRIMVFSGEAPFFISKLLKFPHQIGHYPNNILGKNDDGLFRIKTMSIFPCYISYIICTWHYFNKDINVTEHKSNSNVYNNHKMFSILFAGQVKLPHI